MACHARRLRALCATKSDGSLDIDAISALPFIVFEHIDESPHVIEHVLSFHPKRVIRLPSIPLIASYVEQGIGAAIVPDADLKLFHEHTKVYPMPNSFMEARLMRMNSSNSPTMVRFWRESSFRQKKNSFLKNAKTLWNPRETKAFFCVKEKRG